MKAKIIQYSSAEGYNLAAEGYDQKEAYLNSFEQGRIMPLLGEIKNLEVLDAGAGTGRLSLKLFQKGARVTAFDISEKMLLMLKRKNKKISTVVGDAENLPFSDKKFDLVVAAFLVVHLKNPERFFDEVYRVLKPGLPAQAGGRFIVTNINQKDPPVIKTKKGPIVIESYYHRPEKIIEILNSLAFTVEKEIFTREGERWVSQIVVVRK